MEKHTTSQAYLNIGNQLNEQGKLTQAIEQYQKALQENPDCVLALSYLADIYARNRQFSQAIVYYRRQLRLQPDNAIVQINLVRALLKFGDIQGAINTYQSLPQSGADTKNYEELGDDLARQNQARKAILTYIKAIKLSPNYPKLYFRLTQIFVWKFRAILKRFVKAYQRVIHLKLSSYSKSTLYYKEQQQEKITGSFKSNPQGCDEEIYFNIWIALNQVSLDSMKEESFPPPSKMNLSSIEHYFAKNSQYKIIRLDSLSSEDKQLIERAGLSLNYLKLNSAKLITKVGVADEATSVDSVNLNLPSPVGETLQRTKFQLSMLEEGYIYAVCPSTGRILSSNRSLTMAPEGSCAAIFYRFIGNEVFYLLVSNIASGFSKICLYFPRIELIVVLYELPWEESEFNQLKTYAVSNWKNLKSYLDNSNKAANAVLIDCPHFAHHLWNELSGIYKLYEASLFSEVDMFLVAAEPLGSIDEIFPEIPLDKIKRIQKNVLIDEILVNNYFVVRVGLDYIKDDLTDRIYQTSLKYCHPSLLLKIEEAKIEHFPILWVAIRVDNRAWISQTEGISNIIKKLLEKFPKLGVVFDGFSIAYGDLNNSWYEEIIKTEKETVRNIRSLIPPGINVFDNVGCMMYESICWANSVDIYLSPHGSIQHKVAWIANKPGIVHTNRQSLSNYWHPTFWARENGVIPLYISEKHITDVPKNFKQGEYEKRRDMNSYDCDWRVIYHELLKLASSISRD